MPTLRLIAENFHTLCEGFSELTSFIAVKYIFLALHSPFQDQEVLSAMSDRWDWWCFLYWMMAKFHHPEMFLHWGLCHLLRQVWW